MNVDPNIVCLGLGGVNDGLENTVWQRYTQGIITPLNN